MKPKRVLFICILIFFGFIMSFIVFELSNGTSPEEDQQNHRTANKAGVYELPKLIPSAWYVGK